MKLSFKVAILVVAACATFALAQTLLSPDNPRALEEIEAARLAHPDKVQRLYDDWKAAHERSGGDENTVVTVGFSKGLSVEHSPVRGTAVLDLVNDEVAVKVFGIDDRLSDVWLVDNLPGEGRSALPEAGDNMIRVGTLQQDGDAATLKASVAEGLFRTFQVDVVVVSRPNEDPVAGPMLFGSPSAFQRLYTRERLASLNATDSPVGSSLPNLLTGATSAHAATINVDPDVLLDSLVAQGADLFINETFEGNGRTCATCHPAVNNFTIDPNFIATLPDDDFLFVAEFNPDLATLERPTLMRELGLILENLDGFDDLENRFTMRGVPHTLGLSTSVAGPEIPFDNTFNPDFGIFPPAERTGWSSDGAPGAGSLRDFATGAVTQHFPRTLNRVPGVDFRLPTDDELDAMELFQLSLGRTEEISLSGPDALSFKDVTAERGKEIFNTLDSAGGTVVAGKCALCHNNAGANINRDFFTSIGLPTGGNANFGTGVNDLPDLPADLIAPADNPRDGGFGRVAHIPANCIAGKGGFGTVTPVGGALPPGFCEEDFNTASLVEAADTGPFFHNNSVDTIEAAVSFYNDPAFNDSLGGSLVKALDSGGVGIAISSTQVTAIANMLRIVNSLENIRSSIDLEQGAKNQSFSVARDLLEVSAAELEDARQVLREANLHQDAASDLLIAEILNEVARVTPFQFLRDPLINQAISRKNSARAAMVN